MGKDWGQLYIDLSRRIDAHFDDPKDMPKWAGPYIEAMELKRGERDEAKTHFAEVSNPANLTPEEKEMGYANQFQSLIEKAQRSGDSTVDTAAIRVLQWGFGTLNDNYLVCIGVLKNDGRALKTKALECGFDTRLLIDRARCMCRYSSIELERGTYGFSLYRGRTLNMDWSGSGDLDVDCAPRSSFSMGDKGEAEGPADVKLQWAAMVRDECDWWGFSEISDSIASLMVQYYKDVICRKPPEGHKWYYKRAESQLGDKYYLSEAIKYNEDFYATLKGKVEIDTGFGRTPAKGAKVRLYAPKDDQEWTTTTDEEGKYQINKAILHKHCSPFDISAKLDELETKDTIDGPLEEPDNTFEYEKNLVLKARYSLEFDSIMEAKNIAEWRFSGIIPFFIQREGEMPIVKGEGTIQFSYNCKDAGGGCILIMTPNPATIKWKLSGQIKTLKRPIVKPVLQISIHESWAGSNPIWTLICPDKPPVVDPRFRQYEPLTQRDTVEFYEIEEGIALDRDTTIGGFTNPKKRFILHLTK